MFQKRGGEKEQESPLLGLLHILLELKGLEVFLHGLGLLALVLQRHSPAQPTLARPRQQLVCKL